MENKELKIPLPQKPHIVENYPDENRAVIEIGGLHPGYGATMGNALRRVLYSSLEGSAITTIKIDGAFHEFSTLDNILEDVLEISLNIKDICPKIHGDEQYTMKLSAKGKKEVTAKDIETPSQVDIINKDTHIATLTSSDAKLDIEMIVEKGVGYVNNRSDEKDKKEIGVIKLDANYSPVVKVNFTVDNMRVGDRTDYNRLLVDITTNGIMSPEEAYERSVDVLVGHFTQIQKIEDPSQKKEEEEKAEEVEEEVKEEGAKEEKPKKKKEDKEDKKEDKKENKTTAKKDSKK